MNGTSTYIQNNTIISSKGENHPIPRGWSINSMRKKKKVQNEVILEEYPGFGEKIENQIEEKDRIVTLDEQRAMRAARAV